MRSIQSLAIFVFGSIVFVGCKRETEIRYPSPLPSTEFVKFLPGIVSGDSTFEFNSLFSLDGKEFYFSRNEDLHDIFRTTFDGTQWSSPVVMPFSEKEYKECDPAFSPDGNKALLYINTKNKPK